MLRSLVRDPELRGSRSAVRHTGQAGLVLAALATGFTGSACATFALLWAAGRGLGVSLLPWGLRVGLVAAITVALLAVDATTLRRRGRTCRISLNRQTPKALIDTRGPVVGAFLWGLDTGTAFSTVRVTAATWALFAAAFLGVAPWYVGLAYGVGFPAGVLGAIALPRWRPDGPVPEPQRVLRRLVAVQDPLKAGVWVLMAAQVGALALAAGR